jgi:hypothetical protein
MSASSEEKPGFSEKNPVSCADPGKKEKLVLEKIAQMCYNRR